MAGLVHEVVGIAVDFATTYSGVAYFALDDPTSEPSQISNWPGQSPAYQSFKVPTVIAYCSNSTQQYLWGYEALQPPMHLANLTWNKARAFKAYLRPEYADSFPAPPGKTLADVVRDFLQGMYDHVARTLANQGLGKDRWHYKVLFTVPAPFSVVTVELFKRVIATTGWGQHEIEVELTEPEAAALHTIRTQGRMRTELAFQPEQCFVVLDAGGGTVDLASYAITQLQPVTRMAQTGVIDGDVCGSTLIDRAFRDYLKNLIGDAAFRTIPVVQKTALIENFVIMKEHWEDTPERGRVGVPIPHGCQLPQVPGIGGGMVMISRDQMRKFFQGPVDRACALLLNHVQECIKNNYRVNWVFVVGGFGTSPYLQARLKASLQEFGIKPEYFICPPHAQQAVVLGCLYAQRQRILQTVDAVSMRRCRTHLGLLVSRPFDRSKHCLEERWVHPVTGQVLALNQINWLLKKGDPIPGAQAKLEKTLIRYEKSTPTIPWTETLVECTDDIPPIRLQPGVREICKMATDMTNVPLSEFTKVRETRLKWCGMATKTVTTHYTATYTLKVYVGMTNLKFENWYKGQLRSELLNVQYNHLDILEN